MVTAKKKSEVQAIEPKNRREVQAVEPASGASGDKPRGFAAMAPDRQKAIASLGGRTAHRLGVAHEFSSEEASAAGRRGGAKVASIPGHMAALGRKGAKARQEALPADEGA